MPRIDSITPVQYSGLWPYHVHYDNLPLLYILARQQLINSSVDQMDEILENSIGSVGSLSNRLNQSIEDNGDLKTAAVDDTVHNIGAHADGEYEGIDYVRMTLTERSKLADIAEDATAISIEFPTNSTTVVFDDVMISFEDSDTVTWEVEAPSTVKANMAFPAEAAHQHYYDLVPVHDNLSTPDYTNYKTTVSSTEFIEGSLRVYVNGIRLSENDGVYVYSAADGPGEAWTLTSFTGDHEDGSFALNRAIDPLDTITIDFDISYVA